MFAWVAGDRNLDICVWSSGSRTYDSRDCQGYGSCVPSVSIVPSVSCPRRRGKTLWPKKNRELFALVGRIEVAIGTEHLLGTRGWGEGTHVTLQMRKKGNSGDRI